MPLELDTRQRAMLQEMGVHVWLPESGVAVLERQGATLAEPARPAARAVPPAARAQTPSPVEADLSVARPAAATVSLAAPGIRSAQQRADAAAPSPVAFPSRAASPVSAAFPDWSALTSGVRNCQACALCAGRSHTTLVPLAADAARCDWMVVGHPPDEDEDRAGAPFAGHDGVLLAHMLRALGLQQANLLPAHGSGSTGVGAGAGASAAAATAAALVQALPPARRAYVTNVLKCRPARGAIPQAAEMAQCSAWLQREIALVQPKVIVSLGRFANQVLLGETPELAALPLGKLRGTVHRYLGLPVVVSYPPKQLMRNSADKAKAWADLCLAAATLDAGG